MHLTAHSDGETYELEIDDKERRLLVDALTNHSLAAARGAADSPDHDGRAAPTADLYGGYHAANEKISKLANMLKEGY